MFKIIIIALLLTFTSIIVFKQIDPKHAVKTSNSTNLVADDALLTVSISGEINRPGTYIVDNGKTILDLIEVSGGITANADAKAYDPACVLHDGKNYYIAPKNTGADSCIIQSITKVNINTANKEQLMTINGVGNTVAGAIISYRDANGAFTYLEQIMEVPGIGNATFEKIKDFIVISS